ncbi:MAG: MerR family transcriptional regulator [Acidimicrobiia bacterium]|nr:MerR family transcriptional regulator [Acidimicrobiia bacterium]
MYRIGEFSKICRVPVSALRYYSDIGLLPPVATDPSSGYRYYEAGQLPRLNRILALKDLGLSLDEIGSILDNDLSAAELRGMLRLKQAEMSRAVAEQQAQLDRVESRLRLIESEGEMSDYEIVLKEIDAQHVLSLREIAPEPSHVGTMIGDGFAALMPAGIMPTAPCFSLYHDPEFKPDHIDVEIAYPVPADVTTAPQTPAGRSFGHRIVPGGKMAVTIHQAGYDTIDQAYGALGKWLEANGLGMAGPPQEAYLTAPDDPGGPITEIRIPVE